MFNTITHKGHFSFLISRLYKQAHFSKTQRNYGNSLFLSNVQQISADNDNIAV